MQLRKKLNQKVTVSADYLTKGIALRVHKNGDQYDNSIATIEYIKGKPCLVIFKDTIEHAGIQVREENVNPKEW